MAHGHGEGHPLVGHVVPFRLLASVLGALLLLTVATVGATKFDLGSLNIWIALAIAVVKAALVVLYFMHMRWEKPFNAVIFITALFLVALFIGIALADTHAYKREQIPGYAPKMGTVVK
jgi:cytochrome c oxidase subunit 4